MTAERINQLFQEGHISTGEHIELLKQFSYMGKKNSKRSYITLVLAIIGYALMLTYTKNGSSIGLLDDGNSRLWAGTIFSSLALISFISIRSSSDMRLNRENYAYIGLGICLAILAIVIPVQIMSIG